MSDIVNIQINTTPEIIQVSLQPAEQVNVTVSPVGIQGPQGDQGESGQVYSAIAGETLSGNRVVYIEDGKAYYYDPSDVTLYGRALGITTGAAIADATVNVQMGGVMDWSATPLTPGSLYYAGANGQLTISTSGLSVLQRVGHAIGSDKLKINFDLNLITT